MERVDVLKEHIDTKYNKVFSNYPIGMLVRDTLNEFSLLQLSQRFPKFPKGTSTDWIFNEKLCDCIAQGGTGIAIVSLGSLVNTTDKFMREEFVKKNKILAVIKLPAKLFNYAAISAMIIFGENLDEEITFVDASQEYIAGRRQNNLSEENIRHITDALRKNDKISCSVSYREIAEKDYSLDPSRYLGEEQHIENGKKFADIVKSITRGVPCTAAELDEITTVEPTNYQYLMLANIKFGIIDSQLPYLKNIPEKYKKYCIKSGDILLSKNGYPFKVAVAEPPAGQQMLANGNLYIISLDETQADPYYVKAYLESEQGSMQLKNIAVGTGIAQLGTIVIPVPPLAEQKRLADEYREALDRIDGLRRELADAETALKEFFEMIKKILYL